MNDMVWIVILCIVGLFCMLLLISHIDFIANRISKWRKKK